MTLDTWKMGHTRGLTICVAVLMHSSRSRMKTGILRAPGLLRILVSCASVSCRICGGQMSTLGLGASG